MKKPVYLVTSVPPSMTRRDRNGSDIGVDYQIRCVNSWLRAGFVPVSVNSVREDEPSVDGVRCIRVDRDASDVTGKPLIYFNDLVQEACRLGDGPVAIINADILLRAEFDMCALIERLRPGQCIVGQRTDISDLFAAGGQTFTAGFDFFAATPQDLRGVPDFGLIVGMPWWDYFLPTTLILNGVSPRLIRDPCLLHLVHEDRFTQQHWMMFGRQYLRKQKSFLRLSEGETSRDLRRRLTKAWIEAHKPRKWLKTLLRPSRFSRHFSNHPGRFLSIASTEIVQFIKAHDVGRTTEGSADARAVP